MLVSFVPGALAWAASVLQSSHLSAEFRLCEFKLCAIWHWLAGPALANTAVLVGNLITSRACSHKWSFEPDLR